MQEIWYLRNAGVFQMYVSSLLLNGSGGSLWLLFGFEIYFLNLHLDIIIMVYVDLEGLTKVSIKNSIFL